MENPLISVVVPVYKTEKYLKQCVDSILNQTLKNIEIILVDDGSPDNCPVMCDDYAKQDNRLRVIHQENGGYGKACNKGFSEARGEYIGIVESDDYIESDMYETLYQAAQETQSDIIKASFYHEYKNGVSRECPITYLMLYESSIWSAIYKRSFINEKKIKMLETKGASYQDVAWKFMTYCAADNIKVINKPLYHYRVLASNSSSRSSNNYDAMFVNYAEIKRFLNINNKFLEYKNIFYLHQFYDMPFHLGRLDKKGRKLFMEKMKDVIKEAEKENITIDSFPDIRILPEVRALYCRIASIKQPYSSKIYLLIKNIYNRLNKTYFGNIFWKLLKN